MGVQVNIEQFLACSFLFVHSKASSMLHLVLNRLSPATTETVSME